MIERQYYARKGSRLSRTKVTKYAKRIDYLIREYGTKRGSEHLKELMVKDAKRKTSPLHDYFNWDDKSMAYSARLEDAGNLIRIIEVEVTIKDGERQRIRAFETIIIPGRQDRLVVTDDMYLNDNDLIDRIIGQAYEEMNTYIYRYREKEGLRDLCDELTAVMKKYRRSRKKVSAR